MLCLVHKNQDRLRSVAVFILRRLRASNPSSSCASAVLRGGGRAWQRSACATIRPAWRAGRVADRPASFLVTVERVNSRLCFVACGRFGAGLAQHLHRADALRHASHAFGRRSCRTLGIVNKYRRYLLLAWMAMPVFAFLAFTYGPHHPLTLLVFGVGFLLDRKAMSQVRGRVPTLQEFYHGNLLVKRLSLVWGFVLSALAVWLLTRGQRYGYQLQDYLPGILALIVGPIAVALAVHQVVVFRALGEDDA